MSTYTDLVKNLPMPTEAQTRGFAEFVTGAHSWYKHLRIKPSSPFVFFLDPNAGRAMVRVPEDEVTFVDYTDESEKFHYTWQTTETYRQRFGFWNYEAAYGTSFRYRSNEGGVDTAGSGLRILSAVGERRTVPEPLVRAGTALVSALMWHPGWHSEAVKMRQFEREMWISCILLVHLPFRGVMYEQNREWLKEVLPLLPDDIASALRALLALWMSDAYQRELAETHRAHDEYCKALKRPEPASTASPGFILLQQCREKWEMTAPRREERTLLEPLIAALDRERERQLQLMVRAMNRFTATLHAAGDLTGRVH